MDDRLGSEDTSWLHMEDPVNPMVVSSLVELGSVLAVEDVRALLERGLPARFRCRMEEPSGGFGAVRLTPMSSFRIETHVVEKQLPAGDAALVEFVGQEVSTLLDRSVPLFRVHVVNREGSPTVLLFRVHHALADGFALMELLFSLCDEHATDHATQTTHGASAGSVLAHAASLARLVFLPPDPRTRLKNKLSCEKRVAWSAPIPLSRIKELGNASHATANDVLVSAVAGALGSYLREHGEEPKNLRAMVPVNLRRHDVAASLDNRFGLVVLSLPVGIVPAEERRVEVKRRMDRLKASPEAFVAMDLLQLMGRVPRPLEDLGVRFFGSKASLVLTNVPGPRTTLHLCGAPIERLVFWVPQAAKMGLGVSIFSYAGNVTLGVLADVLVCPEPEVVVRALVHELSGSP